jgi:uncharacterized repeat protein (TIGR04042 family)
MPEVYMQIEWPDGESDRVYSPSSVIREFFQEGETMPITEFEERITAALRRAGERVREVYGMECASAKQELQRVRTVTQDSADGDTIQIKQL